jgi:hypothetical protein
VLVTGATGLATGTVTVAGAPGDGGASAGAGASFLAAEVTGASRLAGASWADGSAAGVAGPAGEADGDALAGWVEGGALTTGATVLAAPDAAEVAGPTDGIETGALLVAWSSDDVPVAAGWLGIAGTGADG